MKRKGSRSARITMAKGSAPLGGNTCKSAGRPRRVPTPIAVLRKLCRFLRFSLVARTCTRTTALTCALFRFDMASSLLHEVFLRDINNDAVSSAIATVQSECERFRPIPEHLRDFCHKDLAAPLDFPEYDECFAEAAVEDDGEDYHVKHTDIPLLQDLPPQHQILVQRWLGNTDHWLRIAESLETEIEDLSQNLNQLISINSDVVEKSKCLSKEATTLIEQKERMQQLQQGLESRLHYFEKVDALTKEVNNPQLDPFSPEFAQMLVEIDGVIRFLRENPHYKSAEHYLSRAHIIQQRALTAVRETIMQRFLTASQSVQASKHLQPTTTVTAETISGVVDILNVEFQAQIADVLPLVQLLEERCSAAKKDTLVYLNDTFGLYYQIRSAVLQPLLARYLGQQPTGEEMLNAMVMHVIPHLLTISVAECKLFHDIFTGNSLLPYLKTLIDAISTPVYEKFRACVLTKDDLKDLAQLIDKLRNALLLGQLKAAGEGGHLLSSTLHKMIQDTQERLIFRCSLFIKDVIAPFRYTVEDCAPLVFVRGGKRALGEREFFPTLSHTVALLQLLKGSVEQGVFEGLGQEAVHLSAQLLLRASDMISTHKWPQTVEFPDLQAVLFLIRHMTALREEIHRAEINLTTIEKWVDLTNVAQRQVTIQQASRDCKQDLDNQLFNACTRFIGIAGTQATGLMVKLAQLLRTAPSFASPTTVHEDVRVAVRTMQSVFTRVMSILIFHLVNPVSYHHLVQPIKGSIVEAYKGMCSVLSGDIQPPDLESPMQIVAWLDDVEKRGELDQLPALAETGVPSAWLLGGAAAPPTPTAPVVTTVPKGSPTSPAATIPRVELSAGPPRPKLMPKPAPPRPVPQPQRPAGGTVPTPTPAGLMPQQLRPQIIPAPSPPTAPPSTPSIIPTNTPLSPTSPASPVSPTNKSDEGHSPLSPPVRRVQKGDKAA
eukprot:TRINITY_DN7844_c0_g1_i1.p1 TRINITY_DN7844_c0_g1~~TRINITY_DN7844_c0_g1_i1.p1  ORF type:complete len:945 (-),score=135.38 TRINITY_DN7844_c0_g1_i1:7-2841(-)